MARVWLGYEIAEVKQQLLYNWVKQKQILWCCGENETSKANKKPFLHHKSIRTAPSSFNHIVITHTF